MNRNLLKKLMRIANADGPEVSPEQREYDETKRRATLMAARYRREVGKVPPPSGEDSCFPGDLPGRTQRLRRHTDLMATELQRHHEERARGQVFGAGAVLEALRTICRLASNPVVTDSERQILGDLEAEFQRLHEMRERNAPRAARVRFEDQIKAIGVAVDEAETLPGFRTESEIAEECLSIRKAAEKSQQEINHRARPIIRAVILRFEESAEALVETMAHDYEDLQRTYPGLIPAADLRQIVANAINFARTNASVSSDQFSGVSPAAQLRGILD